MEEDLLLLKNRAIHPIELIDLLGYNLIIFIIVAVVYFFCVVFNVEERLTDVLAINSIVFASIILLCFQYRAIAFKLKDIKKNHK